MQNLVSVPLGGVATCDLQNELAKREGSVLWLSACMIG